MPTVNEQNLRAAVANVVHFGDTDVLPFPLERTWFQGDTDEVVKLLADVDHRFDVYLADYPVTFVRTLTGVGYNGFRAVTQIEPIWNAYLLALVVELGRDIEAARVPVSRNVVFSYRYAPDVATGGLFDKAVGWRAFQTTALEHAREAKYVLSTDISDFYPRVYHHPLENALTRATQNKEAIRRIMAILSRLSGGTSYGLPIGGNAARILAEILLNRVDRLLLTASVKFCRFVDDYAIFASSREDAQKALVTLSDLLLRNEGLTLGRAKSRLMSSSEFTRGSPLAEPETADSEEEAQAKRFLRIRWNYDPYSPTADEEYDELVEEVNKFDIISMLAREFRKTRVDESLVRQLVRSIKFVMPQVRDRAVVSLADNLATLYPVFPTVAYILKGILPELPQPIQDHVFAILRRLLQERSHIIMVPANAAYVTRILAFDRTEDADVLLNELYVAPSSDPLLRRDIIYVMARRNAHYWLSDVLKRSQVSPWELRALLAASYTLGDEGKHWRQRHQAELSTPDATYLRWLGKMNSGQPWEIPV